MALALDPESIDEDLSTLISQKCTIKPRKTQYEDDPDPVFCFEVFDDVVYVPLGIWEEILNKDDLPDNYPKRKIKCKKDLYSLETDPKGYRDQNVVFRDGLEILEKHRVLFLALPTGFGKTTLGNYFTCHFGLKTVILCHIDKVNEQWVDEFREFSKAKVQRVKGPKPLDPTADVYVIGIQKASKIDRKELSDIGLVIIDEAHIATITSFSKTLLRFQPKYVIGLSATPERADGLHKLLTMYFGPKKNFIHRQEIKDFTVYKVSTPFKPEVRYMKVKGVYVPDWTTIINSIEYNEERHDMIVDIILNHPNNRILVLSARKKQAISICLKLIASGEKDIKLLIGTLETTEKDLLEGNEGIINTKRQRRITVAITGKAGTGFNDPSLDMLVIASDCKNVKQWEGRIRTVDNIIYDCVDDYKTFENHWSIREAWYLKKGGTIKTINKRPNKGETNEKNAGLPKRRLLPKKK